MAGFPPSVWPTNVSADPNFGFLKAAGVHFYTSSIPIAIPSLVAGYGP